MICFAQVINGIVQQVIVADQAYIDTLPDPAQWVATDTDSYGGIGLRANYAGIGYTYDSVNDVFYAPQPYPSWILDHTDWLWDAPVPYPTDGEYYIWDEDTVSWKLYPASWNHPNP